jgi:putative spermidine/putrescine transport system ATP-binding protein
MALIEFDRVVKRYPGAAAPAVDRLDLHIEAGEFLTLLGPSGSGKTTTLMMLAGFEPVSEGTIRLDGQPIERLPAHRRGMGVVFQSYSLFPHMTVAENIGFPLKVRGVDATARARRVGQALERVRLSDYAQRRPQQLSGGQQQRVALARALVFEPRLVLMDEPLAALDKRLREELQLEIRRLHRELGVTMVFVTHDQGEAMTLSDRIAVFNHGRIEQIGAPQTLYDAPATPFVAGFVGDNNRLSCMLAGRDAASGRARLHLPGKAVPALTARCSAGLTQAMDAGRAPATALLCVRPERLVLGVADDPAPASCSSDDRIWLPAQVADCIHQGDHWRLIVHLARSLAPDAEPWLVKLPPTARPDGLALGNPIRLGFQPGDAWAHGPEHLPSLSTSDPGEPRP